MRALLTGTALLAASLLVVGCYQGQPADGALKCSSNAARPCPSSYYCAGDGTCWRKGHSPAVTLDDAGNPIVPDDAGPTSTDDAGPMSTDDAGGPTLGSNGDTCTDGTTCGSGICTDGVCCDAACAGQCQACDLEGKVGTCTTVTTGLPHGTRAPCTGDDSTCGGECTGDSPTACAYPNAQTGCGATCDGTCDGAGHCSSMSTGSCPGGFACGVGGCRTQCNVDGDCQQKFRCNAPNCARVPEVDCLDGLDNNGDGLTDCQDPTCADRVLCVPNAPPGDSVGVLAADTCPLNFNHASPENQGLNAAAADGCYCRAGITCTATVYFDTTSCTPSGDTVDVAATVYSDAVGNTHGCAAVSESPVGLDVSTVTSSAQTCLAVGTPTVPGKYWDLSRNFCAAERSSTTCGTNQICVAKPDPGNAICIRVPGENQMCPTGYTGGVSANWYGDASDDRTCTGCDCGSPTALGDCNTYYGSVYTATSGGCPLGTVAAGAETGVCSSATNPITAVEYDNPNPSFASCNLTYTTGGSAQPIEGATICCPKCSCATSPCNSLACPQGDYCDGAACQSCTMPTFCGSSCVDCTKMKGDTCDSGTTCKCGASAACGIGADACVGGACKCGGADQCALPLSNNCVGGACQCGSHPACDGVLGKCTGSGVNASCKCGVSPPCDPAVSDTCSGNTCRCGASAKCNTVLSDNCTGGACHCGSGTVCSPLYANHCVTGSCKCGNIAACTGTKRCHILGLNGTCI